MTFAALHIATLVYGVIVEIFGFWCPLTVLPAYRGPFLLHYLDALCTPISPRTF